eukprot:TRINITY_DN57414_c0_g1_i1.p1 TRINITY_DN57414_c0_g1~~TRINITY_DN57414_c0_g1_i1.p1  ORF type:complete len:477 (-),score=30.96 TRINITY_DN57414_c0_g1_i1:1618-3048(-)
MGQTVLISSAIIGALPIVKWLIEDGISEVSEIDRDGMTVLTWACMNNKIDVVKYLITETSAAVTDTVKRGMTPLHFATSFGHTEIARWLVEEAGASAQAATESGGTALLCAAASGCVDTVKWLIESGVSSPGERDSVGVTALLCAAGCGHIELVKWLLESKNASTTERDQSDFTILLTAVRGGEIEMAKWLVENGISSVEEGTTGRDVITPLMLAAGKGSVELVELFVRFGADLKLWEEGENRPTPLAASRVFDHPRVFEWILLHGWWHVRNRKNAQAQSGKKMINQQEKGEETGENETEPPEQEGEEWWALTVPECKMMINGSERLIRHLQRQGWVPDLGGASGTDWVISPGGLWSLNAHPKMPVVFQLLCGLGMWCLNCHPRQGNGKPREYNKCTREGETNCSAPAAAHSGDKRREREWEFPVEEQLPAKRQKRCNGDSCYWLGPELVCCLFPFWGNCSFSPRLVLIHQQQLAA